MDVLNTSSTQWQVEYTVDGTPPVTVLHAWLIIPFNDQVPACNGAGPGAISTSDQGRVVLEIRLFQNDTNITVAASESPAETTPPLEVLGGNVKWNVEVTDWLLLVEQLGPAGGFHAAAGGDAAPGDAQGRGRASGAGPMALGSDWKRRTDGSTSNSFGPQRQQQRPQRQQQRRQQQQQQRDIDRARDEPFILSRQNIHCRRLDGFAGKRQRQQQRQRQRRQ